MLLSGFAPDMHWMEDTHIAPLILTALMKALKLAASVAVDKPSMVSTWRSGPRLVGEKTPGAIEGSLRIVKLDGERTEIGRCYNRCIRSWVSCSCLLPCHPFLDLGCQILDNRAPKAASPWPPEVTAYPSRITVDTTSQILTKTL